MTLPPSQSPGQEARPSQPVDPVPDHAAANLTPEPTAGLAPAPAPSSSEPPKPRRRAWLRRSLWTLGGLTLAVGAAVFTPWGTRASLNLVSRLVPGLSVEGVEGSAWRDLKVRRVAWTHGEGAHHTAWTLHDLSWQGWHVGRGGMHWQLQGLQVARVEGDLATASSGEPAREPVTLSLHPWLSWHVQEAHLGELLIRQGGHPLAQLDALTLDLEVGPDAWHIRQLKGRWQRWQWQGTAQLGAHRPFALAAQLQASEASAPAGGAPLTPWSPWQAQAQIQGVLKDFQAQLLIKSPVQPVDVLKASAHIKSFDALPLAQADAQAQGLDLHRLHDAAPQTRLSLSARWVPQPKGMATLDISATNAWPGGLGEQRLPLSDLVAEATLMTEGGLSLSRLDQARWRYLQPGQAPAVMEWRLQPPVAGAAQAAASAWQLQMVLKEWPLKAWWPQGPQVVLGGRSDLTLRASRPGRAMPSDWSTLASLQWQPQLEARVTRPDGRVLPLSWQSEWQLLAPAGDGARDDWQLALKSWRMQSGAEQLGLSGQWRWRSDAAGPWPMQRLQGSAELQLAQFDPMTWWPLGGLPAGSRLQGQARAQWQVDGWQPLKGVAAVTLDLKDSQWLGSAFQLKAQADLPSLDVAQTPPAIALDGQWGGNLFTVKSLGGSEPAWMAKVALTQSDVWAPLTDALRWPRVQLQGEWQAQGLWRDPAQVQTEFKLRQMAAQGWQAQGLQASWQTLAPGVRLDGAERLPSGLRLTAQSLRWPGAKAGTEARHLAWQLVPEGPEAMAWSLSAEVPGGVQGLPLFLQERLPEGSQDLVAQGQGRWTLPGGHLDAGRWWSQLMEALGSQLEVKQLRVATRMAGTTGAARPPGGSTATQLATGALLDFFVVQQAGLSIQQDKPVTPAAGRSGGAAPEAGPSTWRARWGAFQAELLGTSWQVQSGAWTSGGQGAQWQFKADMSPLSAARWLNQWRIGQGWGGDLQVRSWISAAMQAGQPPMLDVRLERESGDLSVQQGLDAADRLPLGLESLRLGLHAEHGQWQMEQHFKGAGLGQWKGRLGWISKAWPSATDDVSGDMSLDVQELGAWNPWLPSPWRIGGRLQGDVQLKGPLGALAAHGRLSASQLSVRQPLAGIRLQEGQLVLDWEGEEARVTEGRIRAGDGWLQLGGKASLGASPRLELTAQAERFAALSRVDRKLVVAGQSKLLLEGQRVQLEGQWRVLEGLWDISQSDAPTLDDDVVMPEMAAHASRSAAKQASTSPERSVQLQLGIDLGDKFRLKGKGLDTRLGGQVSLTAPKGQLQIKGSIRTVEGQYAAYGQNLKIEQGRIDFTGPVANPLLDIQAVRPNLDVVVGVSIGGTAQNPRIRLFSEPDMPATEQLSWLVLGRGMDGLGRADTAVLQRAAWALLAKEGQAGQASGALGLDEFSVRQGDGTTKETVLSLGKQISQRWYVGYERSLQQTTGTWQLVYRLAQRFTLRAQMGSETSVDALWNWKWDGQGATLKTPPSTAPRPSAASAPGA